MIARLDRRPGELRDLDVDALLRACASVRPHHAISGSVNTTAGIASGSNTALWPAIASIATRASCDALCASIGSPATSPIAKIVGSAVRRWPSVSMNPLRVDLHPRGLEARDLRVRPAADGDEHTIERLFGFGGPVAFEGDADAVLRPPPPSRPSCSA